MTQARILINGVPGSNDDLPINQLVTLNNQGNGGESTYAWSILDQPPGTADVLSAAGIQNPTFTPKKEGSYLIKLVVNASLPDEQTNTVIAAVRQLKSRERQPAAGETREDDTLRGWATSLNKFLTRVDTMLGDPGIVVGSNASGGTLSRGTLVRATSAVTIKTGLPGEEIIPGFSKALATVSGNVDEMLCIVEGTIDGNNNVPNGSLMRVRFMGRFAGTALGGSVGQVVFVDNTGVLSLTQGTIRRQVGSIMAVGATSDVWFDGVGGIEITPLDAPYVVYGVPGLLTNAQRVDGANATGVSGGIPFLLKANDDSTNALVLQRSTSAGKSPLEVRTEAGVALTSVDALGRVIMTTDAADGSPITLGELQALDPSNGSGDKRAVDVLFEKFGSTAGNRGGRMRILVKKDNSTTRQGIVSIVDSLVTLDNGGTGATATDDSLKLLQNLFMSGSNPASNVAFVNRLTALSLVKAWGFVQINSPGNASISAGFNVASVGFNINTMRITLAAGFNNAGNMCPLAVPGQSLGVLLSMGVGVATDKFDIGARDFAGSVVSMGSLSSGQLFFVLFGAQ